MASRADVEDVEEDNAWWTTLQHQGVLISPLVLGEIFPDGPDEVPDRRYARLRKQYHRFRKDPDELYDWLDTVLQDLLGHPAGRWEKEHNVPQTFRRDGRAPNRVLLVPDAQDNGAEAEDDHPGGEDGADPAGTAPDHTQAQLLVWIDKDHVVDDDGNPGRIGVYSGRRDHARLVKLLRETDTPVGILTNGHQFRVVHATLDAEAWTEWDARAWFEGGEGRDALAGFAGLLDREAFPPTLDEDDNPLLNYIEESRDRQADLSNVVGDQVREAVEIMLRELDETLMQADDKTKAKILAPVIERDTPKREELRARYQAAIRIVMRLVVVLYAESRELLPKDNPIYLDAYSAEGLFRGLHKARIDEGIDALEKQFSAWPRLQALFRLIYHGSPHPDLNIPSYGGQLFRPPEEDYRPAHPRDATDPVYPALAVFEHDKVRISDATILDILEKLKIARFKSGGDWRTGPVDFSDLRTEYIGMMYEGLLDYDLRTATEDDGGIVFLNIGDEPALPFNVLKGMDDDDIENMIDNLRGSQSKAEFLSEMEVESQAVDTTEDEEGGAGPSGREFRSDLHENVYKWARHVVELGNLYDKHPNSVRAMDPTTRDQYLWEAADELIDRIVPPGGTYLVSWSGTRKSTGTFYTPPGLAVPTVHRTLEPLAYECEEDPDTSLREKVAPKCPEEILDLKVCDPAMGSGTFLVAALNYLTDALKESFDEHVLPDVEPGEPIRAPLGETAQGLLNERILEIQKEDEDDERWEARLEAELKRLVVERCIYGVDINPLAVELAKLSMWVETMNPDLPFTFLDHKLKVGNSLIGAWLHEFMHYPVAAWNRDGANDERDQRIRDFRNGPMKEQMKAYIQRAQHDTTHMPFEDRIDPEEVVDRAKEAFELIHEASLEEDKEHLYSEQIQMDQRLKDLKHLMDRWCAVWFWPMDEDDAPVLDPETFYNTVRDDDTDPIVEELASDKKLKFFHWEVEFPDVFGGGEQNDGGGFDGMLGNPPWEIEKPNPTEFFTQYRPEFRTYGKQQSTEVQNKLFKEQPFIKDQWLDYVSYFRGMSNFVSYSTDAWDVPLSRGKTSNQLEKQWNTIRRKATSGLDRHVEKPFRYQGAADLNTFKLFSEKMYSITGRGGRIGYLSPTGLYLEKWTKDLRDLFLDNCSWEWVYTFHNKQGLFDIPAQENFGTYILEKGQETGQIRCRFNDQTLDLWNSSKPPVSFVNRDQIKRFSPHYHVILEVNDKHSVGILDKIGNGSVPVSERGLHYTTDLHTSGDSSLFLSIDKALKSGAKKIGPGRWELEGEKLFPLYQGRMIHAFDPAYKAFVEENGSRSWLKCGQEEKEIVPKYLIRASDYRESDKIAKVVKIAYRRTSQPLINPRSMMAALIPPLPSADSVFLLVPDEEGINALASVGYLNSYVFDFLLRFRIPKYNLSSFIIKEMLLPSIDGPSTETIAENVARLNWHPDFFPPLNEYTDGELDDVEYETDPKERARIREELDKLVAQAYGLTDEDMRWILRPDNDDPRNLWKDYKERLELLGGKGYWGTLPGYEDETDGDTGQGPRQEARIRWATEDLAMERATEHFEGEGWDVEDVSGTESYDLRCTRGEEELHVEVKGTTTGGSSVILTKNEVEHAREVYPDTALFVLTGVEVVSEGDEVEVAGGEKQVVQPWEPGEEQLEATRFRYEVGGPPDED